MIAASTMTRAISAAILVACAGCQRSSQTIDPSPATSSNASADKPSDDDVGASTKQPAVDESFVTISNSATGVRNAIGSKKGKYVRTSFEVTVNKRVPKGYTIRERFACDVDGKRIVEETSALLDLSKLAPGETSKGDASAWAIDPLSSPPSRCEIVLSLGQLIGDDSVELGAACTDFVSAKSSPGRCK